MRESGSESQLCKRRALGVGALKNHFENKLPSRGAKLILQTRGKARLSQNGIGLV